MRFGGFSCRYLNEGQTPHNLSERVDLKITVALDAMLSQAHRFGISVYESLAREFVKVG